MVPGSSYRKDIIKNKELRARKAKFGPQSINPCLIKNGSVMSDIMTRNIST